MRAERRMSELEGFSDKLKFLEKTVDISLQEA